MNIKLSHLRAAEADVRRRFPELTGEEFDNAVEDLLDEWYRAESADSFYGREIEDMPCLEIAHCDDWGTGEGRYHGRI